MIKLLDTFAGVGGFHLALEQSIWKENIECIGFSEIDKFATQVYKERFPDSPELWSITELDIDSLPDFDLLTWWFPCQDVSVAWKQSLEGGRTVLVEYLLQILEKKQPKYFVFENVKGLLQPKFKEFWLSIQQGFADAWYIWDFQVLNTKHYWIPQNRERVFIVGQRKDVTNNFEFPIKQEEASLNDFLNVEWDITATQIWNSKNFWNSTNKKHLYCLRCNQSNWYILNWETFKLNKEQIEKAQWFPIGWTNWMTIWKTRKQMWNAISVPVVKAIFDNLFTKK